MLDSGKEQKMSSRTGVLTDRNTFFDCIAQKLKSEGTVPGWSLVCFDIVRFKAVNELFGTAVGDAVLDHMSEAVVRMAGDTGIVCHSGGDCFEAFVAADLKKTEAITSECIDVICNCGLSYELTVNAGIYPVTDTALSPDRMLDRASLALSTVKGSYTNKYAVYTDKLREKMLTEHEILGSMATAVADGQLRAYYQPQYDHDTGMLVGAEALVRWIHPVRGVLSPGSFIPVFESSGFITQLDLFMFRQVCRFQKSCLDDGLLVVPVSVNVTRHDLFVPDFVNRLEEIRKESDVPADLLRIEITESAMVGSVDHVNGIIRQLHALGYIVEMDDFGSGYSSLNMLKDIDLDIIKLDMAFISGSVGSKKGGVVLSSVIRMAKWLRLPVIAEGVETVEEADYLKSIGCNYIQGYLYAKPMPEEDYRSIVSSSRVGAAVPKLELLDKFGASFWDPESLETLIFSNFVGGAAIFEYADGKAEILRVNQKYLEELGMNNTAEDVINGDPMSVFDDENRNQFIKMLEKAMQSDGEQESETWRTISSSCCGEQKSCIRSTVRVIGRSDTATLFYAMIRNITAEKRRFEDIQDSERRFKAASEQANIYYWEYTVSTKEMRPCFRCMRDLGLPPLVRNYPEPAIEMGIFPPEVADMYRDWHKQIAAGVPSLEAIIPLTVGRVPFHVRYTTEFDSQGRPIKAYGSATLVVE